MTDQKNKDNKTSSKGTGAALLVGVAVGAAGMYLRDKDNQKKVSKKLEEIRTWSDKNMNMKDLKEKSDQASKKVVKLKEKVDDQINDKAEILEDEVEDTLSSKSLN